MYDITKQMERAWKRGYDEMIEHMDNPEKVYRAPAIDALMAAYFEGADYAVHIKEPRPQVKQWTDE